MQPYFDPTRKATSKKKWKTTSKKIKNEDDLKKNKKNKNNHKKNKKNENNLQKKNEDDLKQNDQK